MHSFVASLIYKVLVEDILKAKKKDGNKEKLSEYEEELLKYRQFAKSAGFAINYGGNGFTIANNLSISLEEGDRIYNGYMNAFPGLKNYFNLVKGTVWKKGYIKFNDIDKFKLFLDLKWFRDREDKMTEEFWDEYRYHKSIESDLYINKLKPFVSEYYRKKGDIDKKALNYPIQGSAASITKVAGLLFFEELLSRNLLYKVKICNFVHDEIVIECPESIAEECAKLLQLCMEKAGEYYCKIIPLKATPVITKFWKH